MILRSRTVGPFEMNCYVLGSETTREAVVIDPGDETETLVSLVQKDGLRVKYILATHAHLDHVAGAKEFKELTGAPFYVHKEDLFLLDQLDAQALMFGLKPPGKPETDGFLNEGDEFQMGEIRIRVLHTPGHSPGGVSFLTDDAVFVGDALFAGSIGRTDLPGGDHPTLIATIEKKLFTLDDKMTVHSGHGPATTIGHEKRTNPFFAMR
ncbi:MAG: MBL fold metallo-hydrolase [Armatimonadetes bacterium]|nr:MBL fold metallo-hydrolase [Armatimonadota bacterium]